MSTKRRCTSCGGGRSASSPSSAGWILLMVLVSLTPGLERFAAASQVTQTAHPLGVSVDPHGTYRLGLQGASTPTLVSGVAAQVDGRWLHTRDYPACRVARSDGQGALGPAVVWDVTCSGLKAAPELN